MQIYTPEERMHMKYAEKCKRDRAIMRALAAGVANAFNLFGASTGLLPPDTLFWQSRGGQVRIGVWVAPGVHTLSIRRKRLEQHRVPLPGLVFVGNLRQYAVFAAAERPARAGDRLYHCPLPNVYDDGRICPGNVPFPACTMATMAQAIALFFESEFNQDLAGHETIELLKDLREKNLFPIERLRPSVTIGEIMDDGRAARRAADVWEPGEEEPYELDPYEYAYGETEDE